jgi:ribosome-associated heat shock protein Hsp15
MPRSQIRIEIEPADELLDTKPILLTNDENEDEEKTLKVRLDKWLWAARFFKTRALARSAIENGRVYYDGQKTIPSKEIAVGATVLINQGKAKKVIIVRQLSTRRRSTDEANALFEDVSYNVLYPDTFNVDLDAQPQNFADKKPRKMVRFLRRALSISETQE